MFFRIFHHFATHLWYNSRKVERVCGMRQKRRAFLIYNAALALLACAVLLYWLLLRQAHFPFRCLVAARLHLYCPGCGFTRALEALFRLQPLAALAANPTMPVLLFTLGYYEWAFFSAMRRQTRVRTWPALLLAYSLLAFFVIRNLLLVFAGIDPLGDLIQFWS